MAKKSTVAKSTAEAPTAAPVADAFESYAPDISFLPIWSKKVKKTADELKLKYVNGAIEIHKAHPTWTPEECYGRSRMRLYGSFKSDMRSNSIPCFVKTDAIGVPYDFGAKTYQDVMTLYRKDPMKAVQKGLVKQMRDTNNKQIIKPWDNKEKTKAGNKNPNYDKALPEHAWIMSMVGLAIPKSKFEAEDYTFLRPSLITVSGPKADPTNPAFIGRKIEAGKWYEVALTNKTKATDTEKYELNVTQTSKFVPSSSEIEITADDVAGYYEAFYSNLADLADYHEQFKDTPDPKKPEKTSCSRIVVTRGQAIDIVLAQEEGSNHRLVLDDESLGFQDNPESVNCWVPYEYNIKFGKFSEIFVIGKTSRSKKKDLVSNTYLEDWQLPNINVIGIVVIDLVEPDVEDDIAGLEESTEATDEEEVEMTEEELADVPLSIEQEQTPKEEVPPKPEKKSSKMKAKKPAEPAPVEEEATEEETEETEGEAAEESEEW